MPRVYFTMKQADIASDLKDAAMRREHTVARAVTGTVDIRSILRFLATADDAAVARMAATMTPDPGHVIMVAGERFVYVVNVGYVLTSEVQCVIEYRGSTLSAMGVRLLADAVVSAATPNSMDIKASSNSVHIVFVPHGEHRRIATIKVQPYVETTSDFAWFVVPTDITYDANANWKTVNVSGIQKQTYTEYEDGKSTSIKTVTGTHVKMIFAEGPTREYRQLHTDVILENDVYTLETSAGPVRFNLANDIPGGILTLKNAMYKFRWGTNVRKFYRVGAGEYYLREVV